MGMPSTNGPILQLIACREGYILASSMTDAVGYVIFSIKIPGTTFEREDG
jgi:hypothetical protein